MTWLKSPVLSCAQYIRSCLQAKDTPHLTLVHTSAVKTMFDKEISAIGAVVSRKSSNPPLPLPPKRRAPTVSPNIMHDSVNNIISIFMSVSANRLMFSRMETEGVENVRKRSYVH